MAASHTPSPPVRIDYGREIESALDGIEESLRACSPAWDGVALRYIAIKLLEGDENIVSQVSALDGAERVVDDADESGDRLEQLFGEDVDTLVADYRYGWINGLVRETVRQPPLDRATLSDRIDSVVTNRFLGIPIFLVAMWGVFKLTTSVSAPFLDWIEAVISGPISHWALAALSALGLGETWAVGLVIDGALAGVGGVLVFVPVLMSLYLALSVLEDSGYMARAAFVMDRPMRRFGLHGKSFLPMLVGFGCTVPAIYATRTLEDERDRILTGLLVPFMSCGARLPVYVLFAAVFFPSQAGTVVFAMYLIGISVAAVLAVVLRRNLFAVEEQAPFVMELPPYRVPTIRGIVTHMWERTAEFVRKAWTVILLVSVLIWVLMAVPTGEATFGDTPVDESLFAEVSGRLAPIFGPLGFSSWESTGALVTGFVAKEVVVSTLAQVYGAGATVEELPEEPPSVSEDAASIVTGFFGAAADTLLAIPSVVGLDLVEEAPEEQPPALVLAIAESFDETSRGNGALAGLAYMVFVLLYTPCVVAVVAARQELGAGWAMLSVVGQFVLAWLVGFAVFQGGVILMG